MLTNLKKIEIFLNKIITNAGKDLIDPEDKLTINFQTLIEAMKLVQQKIGDEKMKNFFQNTLSSLVLETEESSRKDFYIYVLSEFNKENNNLLN